jgi:hypothetical protein
MDSGSTHQRIYDRARGARGRSFDSLGVTGKYVFARAGLRREESPGLRRVFEAPMVAFFLGWVLGVADQPRPALLVVVTPFEPTNFRLAPGGVKGKLHDPLHRNAGTLITARKVVAPLAEFPCVGRRVRLRAFPVRRSSRHASRASWTISGRTGSALTLLAARSTTPVQVAIRHGRWPNAFGAPWAHVINQFRRGEGQRVGFAERVALQELQVRLLAPLPKRKFHATN